MPFTKEQMVAIAHAAKDRPRLARRLRTYVRNVQRIRTLRRVLDPHDANAIGNPTSGSAETYQLEIDRRRAEIARLEPQLAPFAAKEA